jgi:serine/threonine protein kinase
MDWLEVFHESGYVHCDIKPENILIGNTPASAGTLFLIDFGCAHLYINNGKHIKERISKIFKGTMSFASVSTCRAISKQTILLSH